MAAFKPAHWFLLALAAWALPFAARAQDLQAPTSFWHDLAFNPLIALFLIIALGLALGNIRFFGISFGASGVIFTALAFGALGGELPAGIGTFGLVLFVYCVGLNAGPTFFRVFARQGSRFAKLGVALVVLGSGTTILLAWLLNIPTELAVGIYAGAMSSTPALAAGMDIFGESAQASIGYGLTYPIGVLGVVMLVQVLPRLLKKNLDEEARRAAGDSGKLPPIGSLLIEVSNPAVIDKRFDEISFIAEMQCQITRELRGERLVPIVSHDTFETGDNVLVVGRQDNLELVAEYLGRKSDKPHYMDTKSQTAQIVVTAPKVTGRTLAELGVRHKYGVTIERITRNNVDFVPRAGTHIAHTDVLHCVGEPDNLARFAQFAGHRARVLDETDLIYLSIGIAIGVALGLFPIVLPGVTFTLGLAGGPLIAGLFIGHFGRIGRVRGHIPRAARNLLTSFGLILFLASAGVGAGASLFDVLGDRGLTIIAAGLAVLLVTMAGGYLFARFVLKLNFLQILGGMCGGMTSTPGVGTLAAHTDSEIPVISYAAVYPVGMILITLFVRVITTVLGWLT